MPLNRLTTRTVEGKLTRGRYADGGGLVLQVSKWGTRSWVFRYERGGRDRHMGLGPLHTLGLAAAREQARKCRELLLQGRDPIEVRTAERMALRVAAARGQIFRECAEQYITANEASWRNAKHRAQWRATLATYAYPVIGDVAVGMIDTALVLKCIEPIWSTKPETASRVRGRIEAVLDWATARELREGDNPARWRGHLSKVLPPRSRVRKVRHHPALPYDQVPAFLAKLRAQPGTAARALEFTILTAARTNETIGATSAELNSREKAWKLPADRMKALKDHRVPLSARALQVALEALGDRDGFVFSGDKPWRALSDAAMAAVLDRMNADNSAQGAPLWLDPSCNRPAVPHGFRSSFRDWAAESTNFPNEVVEMALAHTVPDEVEAAYRRGDLFVKRRRLMDEWERYCRQPMAVVDTQVVRLRR